MNALNDTALHTRYLAETHDVQNVSFELAGYNMYAQDTALREAVQREGAAWADADLQRFGQLTGSAEYL
ncbi:MAG: DNA alkylation response protein, partial [Gammaproteobacteria bacterium]